MGLFVFAERWREFVSMIENASPRVYSRAALRRMYLEFLWQRVVHGTYLIDYVQYRFYERNRRGRLRFMEYQRLHDLMRRCNDPATDEIFDKKALFNTHFAAFIGREWLDVKNTTFETFETFVRQHAELFVKPEVGSFGHGVELCTWQDASNLKAIYDDHVVSESLIETRLRQHPTLAEFNPTSLNTLRLVTMLDRSGEPHLMGAVFRMGRLGKIADNFHHQGIAAQVDTKSGVVSTIGVDRDFQRYTIHPDSKKTICGFAIPHWEQVCNLAFELAKVVPTTRYVGWDIAITDDDQIVCIEGNRGADPDVTQTTDLIGKFHRYQRLI